jgi:hydroxyacylglutathione hydrolase
MPTLEIIRIPVLSDNYVWLAHEPRSGATAAIDPAVAAPVLAACRQRGWRLDMVLNTHHHGDHTGGNLELKQATGCTIVGAAGDAARIPGIDLRLAESDRVALGEATARVLSVSGHTVGHIAYVFAELAPAPALFCGDTLFSLGCGRMFEGDPATFWASLAKLRALPDDTRVFCAHEYTLANLRFAAAVDPDNPALRARGAEVEDLRRRGVPTIPSRLGDEKQANPFLRADDAGLAGRLGLTGATPTEVFADLRRRKDAF